MSYYFAIIGTKDNPIFTYEFGTSRGSADGLSRFTDDARTLNQFIVHAALDIVEEAVWTTGALYLKNVDRFRNALVSCFVTGTGMKFMLLSAPHEEQLGKERPGSGLGRPLSSGSSGSKHGSGGVFGMGQIGGAFSPAGGPGTAAGAPQATEEAVRQFFADVYENWVKTTLNPFYKIDMEIKSPVFRQRVAAAARKFL
ncbi:MAG: hypothetical protein Q9162_001998 [Coniocarpon cinnabarinum]